MLHGSQFSRNGWTKTPPNINLWYEKLMTILPMERLSHVLKGTLDEFARDWSPIARFLKEEWKKVICMVVI